MKISINGKKLKLDVQKIKLYLGNCEAHISDRTDGSYGISLIEDNQLVGLDNPDELLIGMIHGHLVKGS